MRHGVLAGRLQRLHLRREPGGGTYSPGNGAPAGGGVITWYMRIGTVAVPGTPVPRATGFIPLRPWEAWCEPVPEFLLAEEAAD